MEIVHPPLLRSSSRRSLSVSPLAFHRRGSSLGYYGNTIFPFFTVHTRNGRSFWPCFLSLCFIVQPTVLHLLCNRLRANRDYRTTCKWGNGVGLRDIYKAEFQRCVVKCWKRATTATVELCRGKTRARIVERDEVALAEEIKDRERREKALSSPTGEKRGDGERNEKERVGSDKARRWEGKKRERQEQKREVKLREGRVGAAIADSCW